MDRTSSSLTSLWVGRANATLCSYLYTTGAEGFMRIFDARTSAPSEVDPLLCDYHEDPVLSVSASVSSNPFLCSAMNDIADPFRDDRTSIGALHQNLDKLYFSKRVRKIWKTISSWLRGSRFLLEVSDLIREVGNVSLVQQSESFQLVMRASWN